ncbi:MAG: hypothetical protein ACRYGP_10410 [Janthinobacterium lividum]
MTAGLGLTVTVEHLGTMIVADIRGAAKAGNLQNRLDTIARGDGLATFREMAMKRDVVTLPISSNSRGSGHQRASVEKVPSSKWLTAPPEAGSRYVPSFCRPQRGSGPAIEPGKDGAKNASV